MAGLMTKGQANVLRAFAVWTVFVWGTRIKNVFDGDRGWKFIAVHVALALVSVAFAVACWVIVTRNRGRNAPHIARAEPAEKQAESDD
jgi:predicted Co/Zn/Cd cation transporter (cation efflux family)